MITKRGLMPLLYLLLCLIASVNAHLALYDQLPSIPSGWQLSCYPPQHQQLRLDIHLTPANFDRIEQEILDAATPGHAQYGIHFSHDDVKKRSQIDSRILARIGDWLQRAGITDVESHALRLRLRCSTSQAESLLNTTFQVFEDESGRSTVRTLQYSIPSELEEYIEIIHPTTRFPRAAKPAAALLNKRVAQDNPPKLNFSDCHQFTTPTCLKLQYNVEDVHISPKVKNVLAVNSFDYDYAQYDDLAQFQKEFAPWTLGRNFTWTSINGGKMKQTGALSGEANLDVQYAMAMGYPAQIHVFSTGYDEPDGGQADEEWLHFLDYVLALPDDELPKTMTTSYAEFQEQLITRGYAHAVCKKIALLTGRGVSFIVGSGDFGPGQGCQSNDGKNTTGFQPSFPSTCPWVTSVGGTYGYKTEGADYLSSGGFSNYFARPKWQDAAVKQYIELLDGEWDGLYNKSGRAFPDVAAKSEGFIVIDDGETDADQGTSASSPTFAGIVALLNGARLTAGKPPLGFLNPWIYSVAHEALNDVTKGKSEGCIQGTTPYIPGAGWKATKGWDAVTGWGTPNFKKLLKLALEC